MPFLFVSQISDFGSCEYRTERLRFGLSARNHLLQFPEIIIIQYEEELVCCAVFKVGELKAMVQYGCKRRLRVVGKDRFGYPSGHAR